MILTCLLLFGSAGILKVWTGLIVSPFRSRNRIEDQIRIRLQDGYMEQEYGNIFYRERIPRIPVHVTPSNWKHCSEIFKLNWPSNNPNFFPHFVWDLRDSICDGTATRDYFSDFCFLSLKKSKAGLKTRRRAGRCRMDPFA